MLLLTVDGWSVLGFEFVLVVVLVLFFIHAGWLLLVDGMDVLLFTLLIVDSYFFFIQGGVIFYWAGNWLIGAVD